MICIQEKFVAFHFVFCPRILRNVQVKTGGHVTVKEIITHSKEDATIAINDSAVGVVLNDLFGNDVSCRRVSMRNGTLTTEYSNLVLSKDIDFSKLISNWIPFTPSNACYAPGIHRWCEITTILINGMCYTFDLCINTLEKTLRLRGFNGVTVNHSDLGIEQEDITKENISFILYYISKLNICLGFLCEEEYHTVIRTDDDPICIKATITRDEGEGEIHVISKRCKLVVADKIGSASPNCTECSHMKRMLRQRKESYSNLKTTKSCLLSRKQLEEKIEILSKEKKNAWEQVKYWKGKYFAVCPDADEENTEEEEEQEEEEKGDDGGHGDDGEHEEDEDD